MAFEIKISTGIKNPKKTGTKQATMQKAASIPFINLAFLFVCLELVSLNLFPALDRISTSKSNKIKMNVNVEICAAALILFIPIQTLKIPKVNVSNAKYSTVPKSDTTSMQTNAKPATIAGRAKGKLIFQNKFFLYN